MFLSILVASMSEGLPTSMVGWVVIIIAWTIIEVLRFVGASSFNRARELAEECGKRTLSLKETEHKEHGVPRLAPFGR